MSIHHGLSGCLRITSHYNENSGWLIVAIGAVAAVSFVALGLISAMIG